MESSYRDHSSSRLGSRDYSYKDRDYSSSRADSSSRMENSSTRISGTKPSRRPRPSDEYMDTSAYSSRGMESSRRVNYYTADKSTYSTSLRRNSPGRRDPNLAERKYRAAQELLQQSSPMGGERNLRNTDRVSTRRRGSGTDNNFPEEEISYRRGRRQTGGYGRNPTLSDKYKLISKVAGRERRQSMTSDSNRMDHLHYNDRSRRNPHNISADQLNDHEVSRRGYSMTDSDGEGRRGDTRNSGSSRNVSSRTAEKLKNSFSHRIRRSPERRALSRSASGRQQRPTGARRSSIASSTPFSSTSHSHESGGSCGSGGYDSSGHRRYHDHSSGSSGHRWTQRKSKSSLKDLPSPEIMAQLDSSMPSLAALDLSIHKESNKQVSPCRTILTEDTAPSYASHPSVSVGLPGAVSQPISLLVDNAPSHVPTRSGQEDDEEENDIGYTMLLDTDRMNGGSRRMTTDGSSSYGGNSKGSSRRDDDSRRSLRRRTVILDDEDDIPKGRRRSLGPNTEGSRLRSKSSGAARSRSRSRSVKRSNSERRLRRESSRRGENEFSISKSSLGRNNRSSSSINYKQSSPNIDNRSSASMSVRSKQSKKKKKNKELLSESLSQLDCMWVRNSTDKKGFQAVANAVLAATRHLQDGNPAIDANPVDYSGRKGRSINIAPQRIYPEDTSVMTPPTVSSSEDRSSVMETPKHLRSLEPSSSKDVSGSFQRTPLTEEVQPFSHRRADLTNKINGVGQRVESPRYNSSDPFHYSSKPKNRLTLGDPTPAGEDDSLGPSFHVTNHFGDFGDDSFSAASDGFRVIRPETTPESIL